MHGMEVGCQPESTHINERELSLAAVMAYNETQNL